MTDFRSSGFLGVELHFEATWYYNETSTGEVGYDRVDGSARISWRPCCGFDSTIDPILTLALGVVELDVHHFEG